LYQLEEVVPLPLVLVRMRGMDIRVSKIMPAMTRIVLGWSIWLGLGALSSTSCSGDSLLVMADWVLVFW
jgi:hypothetical protein